MAEWVRVSLENFSLSLFVVAVFIIVVQKMIVGRRQSNSEIVFKWIALLPLGLTGIYTFIMHAFFPEITATNIGWRDSPFQYEVAMADLAIGVLGVLSFQASFGFRLATVIGATIWLWGDAFGHMHQIIKFHNLARGNAGSWLWMDLIIPFILLISLLGLRRDSYE